MKTSRRYFIRNSVMAGSGIALSGSAITKTILGIKNISPEIGICTSVGNSALIQNSGCVFIEEFVRKFLVPDKPEEEFNAKLAMAKQSKLPVIACNSFLTREMKCVGLDAVPEVILPFAETAFQRAALAGVKIIILGSGASRAIPEGFSRDEALKQFINLCSQMAPLAEKYDVTIVLEPLNTNVCNFINSVAEGGEIVKTVNHPNFQLLADIYHMRVDKEDPSNIIKYGSLIRHVHIAETEGYSAPGTHGDDFTAYLKALKKIGYKGAISIECTWQNLESQAPVAVKTVKDQWEY
jgi:sugar phosphate isomerase/epimerase